MRVKCLAQEHNTMSLARALTRTTQSGVKCISHKATAPPTLDCGFLNLQNQYSIIFFLWLCKIQYVDKVITVTRFLQVHFYVGFQFQKMFLTLL